MAKNKFDAATLMEAGSDAHLTDNFIQISKGVNGEEYTTLPLRDIEDNPLQPRKIVNEKELKELAKSIELHGLIHPITVIRVSDKKHILLAGQRRLLAYEYLKLKEIPTLIREDERFENLEKLDMLDNVNMVKVLFEISVNENESREPLTALELALSINRVLKTKAYGSLNEVAQMLGKSRAYISKIYSTLNLADKILDDITKTRGVEHIEALYELQKIKDEALQVELYFKLKNKEINIENIKMHSVSRGRNLMSYDFKIKKSSTSLVLNTKTLNKDEKDKMHSELQDIIDKYIVSDKKHKL